MIHGTKVHDEGVHGYNVMYTKENRHVQFSSVTESEIDT